MRPGTLILLVLFVVAGGYALFFERNHPMSEEREERARVVLDLEPNAIIALRLAWPESTLALERRPRGPWQLIEPRRVRADEGAVSALAGFFDELKTERWLAGADMDTVASGLDAPWVRATVVAADSADSTRTVRHVLAVGSLNPTGNAYFARLDSGPRVALLSSWLVDSNLKRTFTSLRDKRLARFDPEDARRLDLTTAVRGLTLFEEDGAWRIADPEAQADETAVRTLLNRIAQLEATDFVAEDTLPDSRRLAAYGLAAPRMRIVVRGPRDSLLVLLDFGALVTGGPGSEGRSIYARSVVQRSIVVVPAQIVEDLAADIEGLRDLRLVDLGGSEIDTMRVISGSKVAVIARDSTGAFRRADGIADPTADRVASSLPHIRATRFVDERAGRPAELRRYGLDRPSLRLELRLRNGAPQEVVFGRTEGDLVFAWRPGRSGVALVNASVVSDFESLVGPSR
jgi:hypothetical protein